MRISDWSSDVCSSDLTLKPFRSQNSPGSSRCAVVGFAGTSISGPGAGAPVLRSAEAERVSTMRVVQAWHDRKLIAAPTDAARGSPSGKPRSSPAAQEFGIRDARTEGYTADLQSRVCNTEAVLGLRTKTTTH